MLNRVRSLVAVLSLSMVGVAGAQPAPAPPPKPAPMPPKPGPTPPKPPVPPLTQPAPVRPTPKPAIANPYTYCDAKMLSVLWKVSVSDAKATIQAKVNANATAVIKTDLPRARVNAKTNASARCNWDEAGLQYSDVEKLAKLWKTDVSKAKVMIEDKIIAGGEASLRTMLGGSAGGGGGGAVANEDPTKTFLKQEKYTYCDVKILSEHWKTSAKEAKATIGIKIQAGADSYLRTEIHQGWSKTKLKCTYVDGGFTFKDVQTLAKLWSITVAEAKTTIESKLKSGSSIYLKEEIRNGAKTAETDAAYAAFHKQTKYTYCDAHMIGTLWGKSMSDGKLAIGSKLAKKKTGELVKLVTAARKNAAKKEDARCSFYDAGFTYTDAHILAKLWNKSEGEVKALVPEKIALGEEAKIQATLKKEKAKAKPGELPTDPPQTKPPLLGPPPKAPPPTAPKAPTPPPAPPKAPTTKAM